MKWPTQPFLVWNFWQNRCDTKAVILVQYEYNLMIHTKPSLINTLYNIYEYLCNITIILAFH